MMNRALDASKATRVREEVSVVNSTPPSPAAEPDLDFNVFQPDHRLHLLTTTYYSDEILNDDDPPGTDEVYRVIPAYLRQKQVMKDDDTSPPGDDTDKGSTAEQDKPLKALDTTGPGILVATADLRKIYGLGQLLEKNEKRLYPEVAALIYVSQRKWDLSRKGIREEANYWWGVLQTAMKDLDKTVENSSITDGLRREPRKTLQAGANVFNEKWFKLKGLLKPDKQKKGLEAYQKMIAAVGAVVSYAYTRAAYEEVWLLELTATHMKFASGKNKAYRTNPYYRENIVKLQMIKQLRDKNGGDLFDIFVPQMAPRRDIEFTPGNLLLHEAMVSIAARKRLNFGAAGASFIPGNYHHSEFPLKSIDIQAPLETPLYIAIRNQFPLDYFFGMDEADRAHFGTGTVTLQGAHVFYADKHDNDLSAILIIKEIYEIYNPIKSTTFTNSKGHGDIAKWIETFSAEQWEEAIAKDKTHWRYTYPEILTNAAILHPRNLLSASKPKKSTPVDHQWKRFYDAHQKYLDAENKYKEAEIALANADRAFKTKSEKIRELYEAANKQMELSEKRKSAKIDFLDSCISLLKAWAAHNPDQNWNTNTGNHIALIYYHFKTSNGQGITLFASYLHLFDISVATDKKFTAKEIGTGSALLGKIGSNGRTTGPHLHISTFWKAGFQTGLTTDWISTPPHVFFPLK